MERLGKLIAHHPLAGWCVALLLGVAPLAGWCGYRFADAEEIWWTTGIDLSEAREVRDSFDEAYSQSPGVLVIESDDFFRRERIAALRELVALLEADADVDRVQWIDSIPRIAESEFVGGLFGLPRAIVEKGVQPAVDEFVSITVRNATLLPPDDATDDEMREARERVISHPLVAGQLLSRDGGTMLMFVHVWDDDVQKRAVTTARDLLGPHGMHVRLTGEMPLWTAVGSALSSDNLKVQFIGIILAILLALAIFRQPSAMAVQCSGPFVGVFWTMGLLRLFGLTGNELAELILPVMILMIGFTDGVHLVHHLREVRSQGLSPGDAVVSAVRHVGLACFLTSLTTAIGFGSLMIAQSRMIADFGRVCAIGVTVSFVAVILVIPLMSLSWVGRRLGEGFESDPINRRLSGLSGVARWIVARHRRVAVAGILLTVILGGISTTLVPGDRIGHRVPHNSEAYQAMMHCDRVFGGVRFFQVAIQYPEGASHEKIWRVLDQVKATLDAEPLVGETLSIRNLLAILPGPDNPAKLSRVTWIPDEYRLQFWNPRVRRTLMLARVQDLGMLHYGPVIERIEATFAELADKHGGFRFTLTGEAMVENRIVHRVTVELVQSLMLASVIIFAVITVALRSVRMGLVSVVPNVFPLVAAASLRVLTDRSLDIASACSFAVCLGIAVDDTLHLLARFRIERQAGHDAATAIERTMVAVGSALVMTTIVMVSGFATVLTSQLPGHWMFAAMACTTIAAALPADLLILPSLLRWCADGAESRENPSGGSDG